MFKTADLPDIIYTSMADDINVTNNNLYLFLHILIPSVEIQLLFNAATQNKYKISYDEYFTKRRVISDEIVQIDIRSAPQVNSPRHLICAHQTSIRADTPDKKRIMLYLTSLIFENIMWK